MLNSFMKDSIPVGRVYLGRYLGVSKDNALLAVKLKLIGLILIGAEINPIGGYSDVKENEL